jgi:hypothetical protein
MCHDLNLGLMTKARLWKGADWECNPRITLTLSRMWENVKDWTHTLLCGFWFWELESLWTFKYSKNNLKGQNSLDWGPPYIIGNFFRFRFLKWVHIIHLNIYNTSYGQKKNHELKCQFDFRLLKVENRIELHACKWCTTYHWKAFDKRYN